MFSPSIGKQFASISGTVSKVLLNTFSFSPCLSINVPIKFTFRIFSVSKKFVIPKSSFTGFSSSETFRVILLIIPIKCCPAFELLTAIKWFTWSLRSLSNSSTFTMIVAVSTLKTVPIVAVSSNLNIAIVFFLCDY